MRVEDVYLLVLHEPYQSEDHPVPIDATIVHALTLLHPVVPQPDGGRMYRCLTEFSSRAPGCLVPLSTLTFELDGGRLWPQVADWHAVTDAVVHLSRTRACDAMPLGLPPVAAALLGAGPATTVTVHHPDGGRQVVGGPERQEYIDELASTVRSFVAEGPFWPGDGLTEPPAQPAVMPYKALRLIVRCQSASGGLLLRFTAKTLRSRSSSASSPTLSTVLWNNDRLWSPVRMRSPCLPRSLPGRGTSAGTRCPRSHPGRTAHPRSPSKVHSVL